MKKIIVNYSKNYGKDGTVYEQVVKVPVSLANPIREKIKDSIDNGNDNMGWFNSMSPSYLSQFKDFDESDSMYSNLTTARLIKYFLEDLGYDTKRMLMDRNTIVKFI